MPLLAGLRGLEQHLTPALLEYLERGEPPIRTVEALLTLDEALVARKLQKPPREVAALLTAVASAHAVRGRTALEMLREADASGYGTPCAPPPPPLPSSSSSPAP